MRIGSTFGILVNALLERQRNPAAGVANTMSPGASPALR